MSFQSAMTSTESVWRALRLDLALGFVMPYGTDPKDQSWIRSIRIGTASRASTAKRPQNRLTA